MKLFSVKDYEETDGNELTIQRLPLNPPHHPHPLYPSQNQQPTVPPQTAIPILCIDTPLIQPSIFFCHRFKLAFFFY